MMGGGRCPLTAIGCPLTAGLYSQTQGGKKVLKIDGAFAPKVLRFDSPYRG